MLQDLAETGIWNVLMDRGVRYTMADVVMIVNYELLYRSLGKYCFRHGTMQAFGDVKFAEQDSRTVKADSLCKSL
jgi:hypothetical protein